MKKIPYLLFIFLVACSGKSTTEKKTDPADSNQTQKDSVKTEITLDTPLLEYSGSVLRAVKDNDVEKMAGYIHPTEGVRFSPYTSVDLKTNIKMSATEFKDQWTKNANKKIDWGMYDAGEDNIQMTIKQYFKRFVYDLDFLEVSDPSINKTEASGTLMSNISEVYPNTDYVEYYVPGVDKKFDGMDWRALTLVFKKLDGTYYLVGIVHSEWTT